MARQTMVSRTLKSVGVTTGISASYTKPASSAKRQNPASKPGPSTASSLGIVKQSIRDKQFSSEVAEHVSKARGDSTVKVYDSNSNTLKYRTGYEFGSHPVLSELIKSIAK